MLVPRSRPRIPARWLASNDQNRVNYLDQACDMGACIPTTPFPLPHQAIPTPGRASDDHVEGGQTGNEIVEQTPAVGASRRGSGQREGRRRDTGRGD